MTKTLPKLIPVKVSWQVSPSAPFLSLGALEFGGAESIRLDCSVNFGANASASLDGSESSVDATVSSRIRLFFRLGAYARFCSAFSDREVVQDNCYDWSAVSGRRRLGETLSGWAERVRSEWRDTAICPNPRMYEVESSPWLVETQLTASSFKHFLVLGHDFYVDVISQEWRWEVADPSSIQAAG